MTGALGVLTAACLWGCSSLKEAPPESDVHQMVKQPLTPEQTQELLQDAGDNWLYGHGVGSTALNIGAVVMFPPYALYLLGQGAMTLAGYEPLGVTDALPEEAQETWNHTYDSVASIPGRAAAYAADREFIDRETAKTRMRKHFERGGDGAVPPVEEKATTTTSTHTHDSAADSAYRARYSAGN